MPIKRNNTTLKDFVDCMTRFFDHQEGESYTQLHIHCHEIIELCPLLLYVSCISCINCRTKCAYHSIELCHQISYLKIGRKRNMRFSSNIHRLLSYDVELRLHACKTTNAYVANDTLVFLRYMLQNTKILGNLICSGRLLSK